MVKKIVITPKRVINRIITDLDENGSSGDTVLRTAGDPVTLVRMILQGTVASEAVSGAVQKLRAEIWRMSASSGAVLPTFDTSGDVTYGANADLLWRDHYSIMRETTSADGSVRVDLDMKGNRKLQRNEQLIYRTSGSSAMIFGGTLTAFYKEA